MISRRINLKNRKRLNKATTKTVKKALLDLWIAVHVTVKRLFWKPLYRFVETELTEMAKKEALDKMFDWSIDLSAQLIWFVDPFASNALKPMRHTQRKAIH